MMWLKRFTNKGKCSSLVAKINEEMGYRMYASLHSNDQHMSTHHYRVWAKLRNYRNQLERKA